MKHFVILTLLVSVLASGCVRPRSVSHAPGNPAPPAPEIGSPIEIKPVEIPIGGLLKSNDNEISAMAWYGDHLILIPQYPGRIQSTGDGSVFTLPKKDILAYLRGEISGPLEADLIPLYAPGLDEQIKGFEGFEAIAFKDDVVFMTIEASPLLMMGYLIKGTIAPDLSSIRLDTTHITQIPPQTALPNLTDEALIVLGDRLLSIYEANGENANPNPVAHLFDRELQNQDQLAFPNIEYRITDATPADEQGRFWVVNIFQPTDIFLWPGEDPLFEKYGEGPTHRRFYSVERLVELQINKSGIVLAESEPIQLELAGDFKTRNWEGIARLDKIGFLLVTDKIPATLLAFVPLP